MVPTTNPYYNVGHIPSNFSKLTKTVIVKLSRVIFFIIINYFGNGTYRTNAIYNITKILIFKKKCFVVNLSL